MITWHRLFGLTLTDFFTDTAYRVELEKDISIKQQLLDALVIEQKAGEVISEPPDGLENLARHNLMTYKSLRQPLDAWALDELIGHYVNYRKQELLASLTPEELCEMFTREELLEILPPEERLKGLSLDELLKRVPAEEFLKRLTREQIEAYLKTLSAPN